MGNFNFSNTDEEPVCISTRHYCRCTNCQKTISFKDTKYFMRDKPLKLPYCADCYNKEERKRREDERG